MNKQILHKYFAGKTTTEEEKSIMDWAEASADNYRLYLRERKYWNALVVNADLIAEGTKVRRKRRVNLWMWSTVAASLALFIMLAQQYLPEEVPAEKWQSVWVPPGQRAQVTLDDGTKVWLNSRTKLTFPATFEADKRIVKLNGEGYFDVEKDTERPFVVQTGRYDIEVLGTSFNVLSYEDYEVFETALLEGSVQVSSTQQGLPGVMLAPNEKVVETEGKLKVAQIDNADYFRWKEGLICLDDERFEDLTRKFSLYFDIKITIRDPKWLDYRCTGKFRQSDGVDYALRVLQTEMKFNYTRDNELNEIVIL